MKHQEELEALTTKYFLFILHLNLRLLYFFEIIVARTIKYSLTLLACI